MNWDNKTKTLTIAFHTLTHAIDEGMDNEGYCNFAEGLHNEILLAGLEVPIEDIERVIIDTKNPKMKM